jgi:hypothetical protein
MTTFPTLTPSGRTFTPGEYPHTPFSTISGWQNRVRHSNVMLASQVRLTFTAVTEASMLSILSHYQGQLGTFESFDLPFSVWGGVTAADYQLANYLWRYKEPPTVEDSYYSRYNIELTLETVPPDGAIVDGMYRVVLTKLTDGEARTTNGLSKTVTVSFSAVGFQISGLDLTVTATLGSATGIFATVSSTLAAGAAAVPVSVSGFALTVTATLVGGSATTGPPAFDYWSDMAVQLYGWESLAYIEWWGN